MADFTRKEKAERKRKLKAKLREVKEQLKELKKTERMKSKELTKKKKDLIKEGKKEEAEQVVAEKHNLDLSIARQRYPLIDTRDILIFKIGKL